MQSPEETMKNHSMCSRPAGFALVLSLAACAVFPREQTDDPLPSWRDGATKRAILDFVKQVTTKGGPDYSKWPSCSNARGRWRSQTPP
ncbi:MAG: hypothetical protein ACYTGO_16665 [Planctomycetota bacterium]|jgi:hypothetical protein